MIRGSHGFREVDMSYPFASTPTPRMRSLPRPAIACLLGALSGWLTPPAVGQNLLVNPEFDGSVASWSGLSKTEWIADDDVDGCGAGAPFSGSAETGSVVPDVASYSGLQPDLCLNVSPGETVWTEMAAISPHPWAPFPAYYEGDDCAGTPSPLQSEVVFPASAAWLRRSALLTVPSGAHSMRVLWAAVDEAGSAFLTRWDRAYLGAAERIFTDGFEVGRSCRWSASLGADISPPTTPGPISSPSHDGGPAASPLHVSWVGSVDTGGSGLAGYRHRFSTSADPGRCNDTIPVVYGGAGAISAVFAGTWYVFVCAQDHAGNQSEIAVGGPWVVQ